MWKIYCYFRDTRNLEHEKNKTTWKRKEKPIFLCSLSTKKENFLAPFWQLRKNSWRKFAVLCRFFSFSFLSVSGYGFLYYIADYFLAMIYAKKGELLCSQIGFYFISYLESFAGWRVFWDFSGEIYREEKLWIPKLAFLYMTNLL